MQTLYPAFRSYLLLKSSTEPQRGVSISVLTTVGENYSIDVDEPFTVSQRRKEHLLLF